MPRSRRYGKAVGCDKSDEDRLDTNVLVSGLLQPLEPSGQIVRLVAAGELILCHDPRILTEYAEVLRREKFRFDPDRIETLMEQIRADGLPVAAPPPPDQTA